MTCNRRKINHTSRKSSRAPSRSCTAAEVTHTPSNNPSVSTSRCRLRPLTFLPASVAADPALFCRLDALAVEDGGGGRGFFFRPAHALAQPIVYVLPVALALP